MTHLGYSLLQVLIPLTSQWECFYLAWLESGLTVVIRFKAGGLYNNSVVQSCWCCLRIPKGVSFLDLLHDERQNEGLKAFSNYFLLLCTYSNSLLADCIASGFFIMLVVKRAFSYQNTLLFTTWKHHRIILKGDWVIVLQVKLGIITLYQRRKFPLPMKFQERTESSLEKLLWAILFPMTSYSAETISSELISEF